VNVVSFYFTNIPHDISYVALRQGFEVCGILEDVYCNTHNVAFDIPPVGYERFPPVETGTILKDDPTLIRGTESHQNEMDPEAV
jgi:hypothetical protein